MSETDTPSVDTPTRDGSGGMPATRGGISRGLRRQAEREISEQQKQQAAKQKQILSFLNAKVTRKEMKEDMDKLFGALVEMKEKLTMIALRSETLIQVLTKSDPEFSGRFEDQFRRLFQWKETCKSLEQGDYHLRQIWEKINEWNSDPDNPRISYSSFNIPVILQKVITDLDLTRDEKELFMADIHLPAVGIKQVFDEIEKRITPQETIAETLASAVSEEKIKELVEE